MQDKSNWKKFVIYTYETEVHTRGIVVLAPNRECAEAMVHCTAVVDRDEHYKTKGTDTDREVREAHEPRAVGEFWPYAKQFAKPVEFRLDILDEADDETREAALRSLGMGTLDEVEPDAEDFDVESEEAAS